MRLHQYLVGWLAAPMFLSASALLLPLAALAQVEAHSPTPLLQIEGALTPDSPLLSGDGTPYAEHTFEGQAGQTVTLVMESLELDAYLFLYDPDGQKLAENDDFEAGNYNAVITVTLPVDGTYRVRANAYETEGGAYTLTVLPGEVPVFSEAALQQAEARRLKRQAMELSRTGEYEAALELLNQAIVLWRKVGDRRGEAISLSDSGLVYRNLSRYAEALEAYHQALGIQREIGDRNNEATALNNMGSIYYRLGDYPKALELYQESLNIREDIGDEHGQAFSLNSIGLVYQEQSQFAEALEYYSQALGFFKNAGDAEGEAAVLNNMATIYEVQGNYSKALEIYQQNLQIRREGSDRDGEATDLNNIAGVYSRMSDYEQALNYYQQGLSIRQAMGDRSGAANILNNIGRVYSSFGDYPLALDYFQQSLTIRRDIGDRAGEAVTLSNIGTHHFNLGDYPQALNYYQQSLDIHQALGNRVEEATVLGNLGSIHSVFGDYGLAVDYHQQALDIRQATGDREGIAISLNNIGVVYNDQGDYLKALSYYQQALPIFEELGNRQGVATLINNFGSAYESQSNYSQALNYYQQALAMNQAIGDRSSEANTLGSIGTVYDSLGNYAEALKYYQQALAIRQDIGDRRGEGASLNAIAATHFKLKDYSLSLDYLQQALAIFEAINDRPSAGRAWANIGSIHREQGSYGEALDAYQHALTIIPEVGDRYSEGVILSAMGETYRRLNDYSQALQYHQQALAVLESLGARDRTSATLRNLGRTLADQGQPELAIVFYKQSINLTEAIRGEIQGLEQGLQQSYTDSIAEGYRELADLLLQQNRVLEAQRVLDLLKVQELDDYLQGVQRTAVTAAGVDFLRPESAILARHGEQVQSAIAVGQELATLQAVPPDQRTADQTQRIAQLTTLLDEINGDFRSFSRSPEVRDLIAQLSFDAREASLSLGELDRLRDELSQLNAAIFYPLILEDRIELIITTPDSPPLRRTVYVPRTQLNEAILAFRTALTSGDPAITTPAQQLYDWLIRPLEADLQAAGVETIIYAPDGQLRYIPLAALHDGEGWLAQRYQVNNITARSLQDFTHTDSAAPRILAAAYADPTLVHRPTVNGTEYIFEGLPGAGQEVAALPNATTTFIDNAFSLAAVRPLMADHTILHFATHAAFVPGVPEDSFILFGNGDTPTLRDVETWTLNGVDLVVLSACETGVGGLGNGEEILGLGYQFQLSGARAVMSSLWKVSDQGTQVLMTAFYNALGQGMTKAEALQAAQKALITGDFSAVGGLRGEFDLVSSQTRQTLPAEGSISHPYYWAPFILIGNGL
ncbi:tetratricopeptide repeat protein [Nodosilinea sp. LEGE 07298]|uniref:tetratricopeptide repeat protein n=1 Tax=Nodosilinea sp. LEGE 07298 TaxID=2777970 RepID=UPI001882820B|nr:tetratricopeptide repeat protein [Nodosilinea sp. LEGE 07298]MBE9109471.1 tetratricopeptide repeat protein [Nodosilinea sp. LEGE 07298]